MGLYKQPNLWSCGPFALKHALVALGQLVDERAIARIARTHWWSGTDEVRLARAARAYDCDMPMVRRIHPERARRSLLRHLRRGEPVLLCVDDWEHWIVVVHHERDRFVLLDSREDPVLQVLDWPALRRRWRYADPEDDEAPPRYDLHPVKPRSRVTAKAAFSAARARFLRRPENLRLARHWDQYLGDLLEICRPPSERRARQISVAEFLRRHRDLIVGRVAHWHGGVDREDVKRLLRNLRFVAETYGLVVPSSEERRALVEVAVLATLWAAGRQQVAPLYDGADTAKKR